MDQETLILMQSVLSDDAKGKRLAEIMAAQDALKAKQEEIALLQRNADGTLAEAKQYHQAGDQALAEAKQHYAEIADKEAGLEIVITTLNQEKAAFSAVRAQVEADHTRREVAVSARESAVQRKEAEVAQREAAADDNLSAAVSLRESLTRRHQRLEQAMDLNKAEEEGDKPAAA
jgi:DNA-binding LacI/PurR family transcriptional regulator